MQNNTSIIDEVTPIKFFLSQNYPNPFKEKTSIKYCVAYKTRVVLTIYNSEGEVVEKLVDEEKNPGTYEVEFSACHSCESLPDGKASGKLDQGYYFYRMTAGDFTSEKKWLCINKLSGRFNMKSLLQILFFFLLVTQICFAQWYWQNPMPTHNTLNDVTLVDDNNGWAVGDNGTIIKTTNGGLEWFLQESGTTNSIREVCFVDVNNGWAVGDSGIIIHTSNGGIIWTSQTSGTIFNLSAISFSDENNGWVVGSIWNGSFTEGTILSTNDGGITWISQFSGTYSLIDICFINAESGWAVGTDGSQNPTITILKTTNGGTTWSSQLLSGGAMFEVCFRDLNNGWAVGFTEGNGWEGIILNTTNGGNTWLQQTISICDMLNGVCFTDVNNGWAVGRNRYGFEGVGIILKSTDGGTTWNEQTSGTRQHLTAVSFSNSSKGVVVGEYGGILNTIDGGNNWLSASSSNANYLHGVYFANESIGTAVGSFGTILMTSDGGIKWSQQSSGTMNALLSVSFAETNTGTTVGDNGTILRTTNGGTDWFPQSSGTTLTLSDVFYINENIGWIIGSNWTAPGDWILFKTTNGGTNWETLQSGLGPFCNQIFFSDTNNGWIVGGDTLLHTIDGGYNWSGQSLEGWFYSGYFIDNNNGWLVGSWRCDEKTFCSKIIHTTDEGINWNTQFALEGPALRDIFAYDALNVTAVGQARGCSAIYNSTDGGETWTNQEIDIGLYASLNNIYFTDVLTGWAVGDNGIILHTTNGGVTFVEEEQIDEIPTEFLLSQNYPNPFNPNTKIKYSVPQSSNVVIKVFDILGNEIETLVDEEKRTGQYEITWYSEQLPSGVYFYQIKAGSYVDTKKMLLLK